jgi:pimeloyl-ACP methyl ester carboxylesterase
VPAPDPTPFQRQDVRFASGESECAAWLYLPPRPGPGPAIVLGHGLGAVKEMRLDAYAERFAAAGFACLLFDYRHFGASGGEPRQLLDVDRQLEDWAAALRFARGLDAVDPDRVGIFGSSFGGGHVIVTAARDPRVAAVVAQCPFTDGLASSLTLPPASALKVGALAARDLLGSRLGAAPVRVALAGRPGEAALMATGDAVPGYLGLLPPGLAFENEVAARVALQIMTRRPGRAARLVHAPILFCICDSDSVAPAGATARHAAQAPRAEIVHYPCGHFDIYQGGFFERAVADQLEFFQRRL